MGLRFRRGHSADRRGKTAVSKANRQPRAYEIRETKASLRAPPIGEPSGGHQYGYHAKATAFSFAPIDFLIHALLTPLSGYPRKGNAMLSSWCDEIGMRTTAERAKADFMETARNCLAKANDGPRTMIQPDESTVSWLCTGEKKRWNAALRSLVGSASLSLCVCILFAATLVMIEQFLIMLPAPHRYSLLVIPMIIVIGTLVLLGFQLSRLSTLLLAGKCGDTSQVLRAAASNVMIVGDRGIYVRSLQPDAQLEYKCDFHPHGSLMPRCRSIDDIVFLELLDRSGYPIRSLFFYKSQYQEVSKATAVISVFSKRLVSESYL